MDWIEIHDYNTQKDIGVSKNNIEVIILILFGLKDKSNILYIENEMHINIILVTL